MIAAARTDSSTIPPVRELRRRRAADGRQPGLRRVAVGIGGNGLEASGSSSVRDPASPRPLLRRTGERVADGLLVGRRQLTEQVVGDPRPVSVGHRRRRPERVERRERARSDLVGRDREHPGDLAVAAALAEHQLQNGSLVAGQALGCIHAAEE